MKLVQSLLIIAYSAILYPANAQIYNGPQNQYKFKYLTIDQGLSNNSIRTICQDSEGFIWFGTQNGLNKYDGQSFTTYWSEEDDSTTLTSNIINEITLDSHGNLWVADASGISIYNREYDNFIRFRHKDITWPIWQIFTVKEDKNGIIWFGGSAGLYGFNTETEDLSFYSSQNLEPEGIFPNSIYNILIDDDNRIWCSVINEGLYVLDQEDKSFTRYMHDPDDETSIIGDRIEKLFKDANGNIWAGTLNNGLSRFVPENNNFIRYNPDPANEYASRVRTMFEDFKGDFFIGTRAGIYKLDKVSDKFQLYANEEHNFSKLSQNSIRSSLIDNNGTLWIGTFSGGVNYTYLNQKEFTHFIAGKDDNQYLSSSNIYAIEEDPDGNLWIGSDLGLNYFDRKTYTFTYYLHDKNNPKSLSYSDVKDLEYDKDGNLWVGTNRGGLNKFNKKTGAFTHYKHDPNDPTSIRGDKVYCLLNDRFNNLWIISTPDNNRLNIGVDLLPNGQNKFIHLEDTCLFGLAETKSGNILIGKRQGFVVFSPTDSSSTLIEYEGIRNVNILMEDSNGMIWIGSDNGLSRYNSKEKSFIQISKETGYPIDIVYGLLEDDNNNLWVSTISGLIKIENIDKDSSHYATRVFNHYDGLQSRQFNFNSYYKCRSGEMVFGGVNGFSTFFPEKIIENKNPIRATITKLFIYNDLVPIGEEVKGEIILKKSITVSDKIVLNNHHKIFSIEFASLNNNNPDDFAYKTKLVGLNTDWQYRKFGNNQVTYTNLAPGEYTFLVAAANNDGYWNENPTSLKIIIKSPYWATWWFRIGLSLLIIGIVVGIYFLRVNAIRNKNIELEKTVKKRTREVTDKNKMLVESNLLIKEKQEEVIAQNEELERNRNELRELVAELEQHRTNLSELVKVRTLKLEHALEKAKESDALKSAFLANMSHEIRTPMNAIMGFSNLLVDEDYTAEEKADYVGIIQSNSASLIKIIDEILDLSLIESNQLKISKNVFELNVVFDHLYSYYFLNNTNSGISINKNNQIYNEHIKLNSDEVRFKQIITNLMDNATKFTTKGEIELGAYINKGNLCLYVKDTGRGIPADKLKNIFLQFIKIEDNNTDWTQGLGLGLAISNNIAHALGGKILVDSELGKGSTFTLSIPLEIMQTEEQVIHPEIKKASPERWSGKTVLIAEDVEANFIYLKKIFKNSEINLLWAKDGEEAIQIYSNTPNIDLILMDIKMPKLNGYDAAKIIKQMNPDQVIIAQTAYARSDEKQKFFDENFDEYIAKPINPNELTELLGRFL